MGGRARSLLRWLRHRSRRVSSFHLTSTTNNDHTATSKDLHAHSLPHQYNAEEEEEEQELEEEGWQEVAEGPESAPEGCIVFEERGAGPRAPVRTKPPPMDPSKKVGQLNSVPVIALVDLCGLSVLLRGGDRGAGRGRAPNVSVTTQKNLLISLLMLLINKVWPL